MRDAWSFFGTLTALVRAVLFVRWGPNGEDTMGNAYEELDELELDLVQGGMRWQDFPRSNNVEDRRNDPPGTRYPTTPQEPLPDLSKSDLAKEAGIDDIGKNTGTPNSTTPQKA